MDKEKRKKDKEEKFIELFSSPMHTLKHDGISHSENIIKKEATEESGIIRKIEVQTNEDEPSVYYYEHDGRVDVIEFVCTCGKRIKVRLKYDPSNTDNQK